LEKSEEGEGDRYLGVEREEREREGEREKRERETEREEMMCCVVC
jgi:hypothetical protein